LIFFAPLQALAFTHAPSCLDKIGAMIQPVTLTISLAESPRLEIRPPRRNSPKISFFHHRNQITKPHVQITSVNSC
jgi:hypothetical protein